MKNAQYNTSDIKGVCERKLDVVFRPGGEFNGWVFVGGKKTSRVTIPKGKKQIPPKTYKSMASQLRLSVDDFDRLLDCPLKRDEYDIIVSSIDLN